jgi:cytoskeletal protein RodZ
MAIGPTLQDARLKKQLTTSQVAEITRMKVQIVDDLEHDDFHRIAATIYGKGFIKLFAECVDLDPKQLIADYMRSVKGEGRGRCPYCCKEECQGQCRTVAENGGAGPSF